MSQQHKRAPNGYAIERWVDGFYHVYWRHDSCKDCLTEVLSKREAIKIAWEHRAQQLAKVNEERQQ